MMQKASILSVHRAWEAIEVELFVLICCKLPSQLLVCMLSLCFLSLITRLSGYKDEREGIPLYPLFMYVFQWYCCHWYSYEIIRYISAIPGRHRRLYCEYTK